MTSRFLDPFGHIPSGNIHHIRRGKAGLRKKDLHFRCFWQNIPGHGGVGAVVGGQFFPAHKVGDDEVAARVEDTAHLLKGVPGILKMGECGKADDPVERFMEERDVVDIGLQDDVSKCGRFLAGPPDHLQGEVKGADSAGRADPFT